MQKLIALLSLGLALCSLSGCGKKTEPQPSRSAALPAVAPVKLALDWVPEPEFGGFYAAREDGAYARHGLNVEIQGGGAGKDGGLFDKMRRGFKDLAGASD